MSFPATWWSSPPVPFRAFWSFNCVGLCVRSIDFFAMWTSFLFKSCLFCLVVKVAIRRSEDWFERLDQHAFNVGDLCDPARVRFEWFADSVFPDRTTTELSRRLGS